MGSCFKTDFRTQLLEDERESKTKLTKSNTA